MLLKLVLESPRSKYSDNFCAFLFRLVRFTCSSHLIFQGNHGDNTSVNNIIQQWRGCLKISNFFQPLFIMSLVVSTRLLFLEITKEERKRVEIRWGTVNSWFIPLRLGFSETQNQSTGRSVLLELPSTKIDVFRGKIRYTYLRTRDLKFQRADCSYPWVMRTTALNQLLILKKVFTCDWWFLRRGWWGTYLGLRERERRRKHDGEGCTVRSVIFCTTCDLLLGEALSRLKFQ